MTINEKQLIGSTLNAALIVSVALIVLLASTVEAPPEEPTDQGQSLALAPCDIAGVEGKALCGTYEVYENRATKKGRKISLKMVVLPATGRKSDSGAHAGPPNPKNPGTRAEHTADAWFYIPGGPGSSATEDAPGIAPVFAKVREHRDLVFVDQRGTGGSHPLNCDFYNSNDLQSYLGYFFPLDDVRICREKLQRKADLKLYTTSIAMDDLDEVRAALGYERVNIFGVSYGTRAALVYLKRHPKSVRTVTLQGVAPTDQYIPLAFAQHHERALQGILSECAADEVCNKAFPNIRAESKTVLERLLKGPVEVGVRRQTAGPDGSRQVGRAQVKLSRDLAAEAIRYMLYGPVGASRVPLVLHEAAQGNFTPLAEAALLFRREIVASGSTGLYLSITCAEDLPWIKPQEGERLAANTFLGDYRLRQQREACALWPKATIPADHSEPTKATAPVLIITGEWDPVTPPSNGDAAARYLPNSLHIIVPHGAHGIDGLEGIECLERLANEFVERASVKGLDVGCVKGIRRKGWAKTVMSNE